MNEWHSIWLMPSEDDLAFLTGIVAQLSDRFVTERFCPHLTLVEDMPRSRAALAEILDSRFSDMPAFRAPIVDVTGLPLFFRSLFAAFEPAGDLRALKARAVEHFETGDVSSFMPHISLAYGVAEADKAEAITELRALLVGREILFDRVAVVNSAQSVPIADWAIVHSRMLS